MHHRFQTDAAMTARQLDLEDYMFVVLWNVDGMYKVSYYAIQCGRRVVIEPLIAEPSIVSVHLL